MKKSPLLLMLLLLMVTNLVYADNDKHQDAGNKMSAMDMPGMTAHMDKMQALMTQAQNTQDPKKQKEIMQAHMKEMQQGIKMMNNMMPHKSGHQMKGKHMDDPNDTAMKKRQDAMEMRMTMMQQMMEHMMNQQSMMTDK